MLGMVGIDLSSLQSSAGISDIVPSNSRLRMVDTAQHSTAQHSTAQHSTAKHSTAQHSTAYLEAA